MAPEINPNRFEVYDPRNSRYLTNYGSRNETLSGSGNLKNGEIYWSINRYTSKISGAFDEKVYNFYFVFSYKTILK